MAERKRQCSKNTTQKTKDLATRSPQGNKLKKKKKEQKTGKNKKKTKKQKPLLTIGAPEG
jgi:hypothetical protein